MQFIRRYSILLTLLAALLLSACGLSLAGDVTPPPNYRPPTPAPDQPVGQETVFPIVPPDPAQGEAIYAQKCLPCHGERGMGDGPQASNLPNPPAPIGNPDLARTSRPIDWYETVTNGNLEKFMPGFTQSLSDRQRWDVVAYVYTLSASQDELAQGKARYDENCAACHGDTGAGDGVQAASLSTKPTSWIDQSKLVTLSSDNMVAIMSNGSGEMPAYQGKLDQSQLYAIAAYIRTLGFAGSGLNTQQASGETTPAAGSAPVAGTPAAGTPAAETAVPAKIIIAGKVTNGTPGGKVPSGLKVQLSAFDSMNPAFDLTADVAADGTYRFEDVDFNSNFVYLARVVANNVTFNSDILHGTDVQGGQADLPVKIYDTTTDVSELRVDRLHVFFDFSQPGIVQVVNLYIISNPSGRVVIPMGPQNPVVRFDLPDGATNLQFQDGQLGDRYIQTDTGFGDMAAVEPGEAGVNQVLFAYDLPYNNSLNFDLKVPMPVDATTVMVPVSGISLNSNQLIDAGQQDVQGMSFHMYQAGSALAAGDTINLSLKGQPGPAGANQASPTTYLFIGLGAFGLALIGAGYWMYRQRSQQQLLADGVEEVIMEADEAESSDALLDAIVALDDQHASGGLPEAAYQQRRAELKARLAAILASEKGE